MNRLMRFLQQTGLLRALPWLLFVLGLSLTYLEVYREQQRERTVAEAELEIRVSGITNGLTRRVISHSRVLSGVAGLFAGSDEVSREEFRRYVAGLRIGEYYPGLRRIDYAAWVVEREKDRHVAAVRGSGFPEYNIWPGGVRDAYAPLVYIEPLTQTRRTILGYDLLSEPVRAKAALQARDEGRAVLSGKDELAREPDGKTLVGAMIMMPLYRPGASLDTVEQRRAALFGWIVSPLLVERVANRYLAEDHPDLSQQVALRVYDGEARTPDKLLYDSHPEWTPAAGAYLAVRKVPFLGTVWTIAVEPLPDYWVKDRVKDNVRLVIVLGLGLTLLLTFVGKLVVDSHRRVAAALEKTEAANLVLIEKEGALRLASAVMEASPGGIVVTDAYRRIVAVNPAFTAMLGYALDAVAGQTLQVLESGRQSEQFYRELWRDVETAGQWEGELIARRKDGGLLPVMGYISRVLDEQGEIVNYVALFFDITERRKAEERIHHLAHHDYLTGLPNRLLLVERATQALALARRYQRRMAIIFIDLDRFKPINDEYGHDAGDAVLRAVARRLSALVRQSDTVCRQGGDEFVILLPEFSDLESLEQLAHKLRQAIEEPCAFEGHQLTVSGSVGIATFPENGDTVDAIIQSADSAMYHAKADGKHVCFARCSR